METAIQGAPTPDTSWHLNIDSMHRRSQSAQLFELSPYFSNPALSPRQSIDLGEGHEGFSFGLGDSLHSIKSRLSRSDSISERCWDVFLMALQIPLVQFILAVLVVSTIFSVVVYLHKEEVYDFLNYVESNEYAPFAFAGIFSVYVTFCLPCTFMEILAGYLFKYFLVALGACTIGKFLGCCFSYALGKFLGTEYVRETLLGRYSSFKGLQLALSKKPWEVTFLIRLSYIPLMLKNYGLSVMECPFPIFAFCSFFASVPYTISLNHAGRLAKEVIQAAENNGGRFRNPWEIAAAALGSAAVVGFLLVTRTYTRTYLEKVEREQIGNFYEEEGEGVPGGAAAAAAAPGALQLPGDVASVSSREFGPDTPKAVAAARGEGGARDGRQGEGGEEEQPGNYFSNFFSTLSNV